MSTFIEKMLGKPAGTAATVTPNYIVINDGVSHRAVDEITAVADRERVWVIYDHDVPTGTPQGSDRLKKNLMFAKKYGCRYIQAKGVGYQYMLNCVVKPGEIVIGAGSHGSIFGAHPGTGSYCGDRAIQRNGSGNRLRIGDRAVEKRNFRHGCSLYFFEEHGWDRGKGH